MATGGEAELFEGLPELVSPERGGGRGAARLRMAERRQVELRAISLEDLVPADHRVRLVWRFVEGLDLSGFQQGGGGAARPSAGGPAHPGGFVAVRDDRGHRQRPCGACATSTSPINGYAAQWLCGGGGMNAKTLADFRVDHGTLLERLLVDSFTALVRAGVASLDRIAQDGVRVRASAGAASFRRDSTLEGCRSAAEQAVRDLRAEVNGDPGALSRRQAAARQRAAEERRVRDALAVPRELRAQQEEKPRREAERAARQAAQAPAGEAAPAKERPKEPRASTTDAQARIMKMADGGYRPAYNVQFASDTRSGAIAG